MYDVLSIFRTTYSYTFADSFHVKMDDVLEEIGMPELEEIFRAQKVKYIAYGGGLDVQDCQQNNENCPGHRICKTQKLHWSESAFFPLSD